MNKLQNEIINELGVKPTIDVNEEIENRIAYIVNKLGDSGLKGFVLGISGGQDSLLAGMLAQRAAEQVRADGGQAEFHAVLLPYGQQADRDDALLALSVINPDYKHDFDISRGVDGVADTFVDAEGQSISDFSKGNLKARVRMATQYVYANEHDLLVIGTDHAAEAAVGFFTKYGDGGADILPLSGLNKRQGRAVLRALGAPERFMTKAPTADLLDVRPGQPDEFELGLTYDNIDDYLEGKTINPAAAKILEDRFVGTIHKRELPDAYTNQ